MNKSGGLYPVYIFGQVNSAKKFVIEPGWQLIFKDLGISVSEVLLPSR